MKTIQQLAMALRDAGIPVSTDEYLSLNRALEFVDYSSRSRMKSAFRSLLVRDSSDIPIFDRIFDAWMGETPAGENEDDTLERDLRELMAHDEPPDEEDTEELAMEISFSIDGEGNPVPGDSLTQILREKIRNNSRWNQKSREERAGMIQEMLRSRERLDAGRKERRREEELYRRPIYRFTADEVASMRQEVRRLAQKIRSRVSLRKKRMKRGTVDIRGTLRRSLQYGGVPMELSFHDRKKTRPQLVVLCDVSNSVNQFNRFMLLLTHSLQGVFSRVKTFAFVSRLVEITPLLRHMDPERAINGVINDRYFTYGYGTHYGAAFRSLARDHASSLNRRTTLLILGDARNNHQSAELECFKTIASRCRHIFWLNPESEHLWTWGDSIATQYQPHCTVMSEVQTLQDLSRFMDELLEQALE
jgi:hypothetical protein